MELEGARLQLLLQMAFGPRLAEGQAEWRDVPEVVRSSFLLMAKELRRLHRLVAANLQTPLQRDLDPNKIADLQAKVSHLKDQLVQDDARHSTADAQAQQAATIDRIESRWSTTETQLKILRTRMEDRQLRSRIQSQQVDQALHELQKSQELCRQELRGLQRSLEATMQVRGVEVRAPERSEHLKNKVKDRAKKHDGAAHILLHQRYVEALKKQQQHERESLLTVEEDTVTAQRITASSLDDFPVLTSVRVVCRECLPLRECPNVVLHIDEFLGVGSVLNACRLGSVRLLSCIAAEVNWGEAPYFAAMHGHVHILQWLSDFHADQCEWSVNDLDIAASFGHSSAVQ